MKIENLIIFIPSIDAGGAEKNLFLISNYLVHKIKKVIVVTASKSSKKRFNKNIEIVSPKTTYWEKYGRYIKTFISIFLLIKIFLTRKNVIVFSFQSNISAIILSKIFFRKIITRSNSFPNSWTDNFYKKKLFKYIYKKANHTIVNSNQAKRDFIKYYNIRPTCIFNPLNFKQIEFLSKKKVPKIFKSTDKLKIIIAGRLSPEKDHITFLKAINIIKNDISIESIIMGKGEEKRNIQNFIKINKLNKIVKLIDFKLNPYPYLKQADFIILTSLHEGLPNILIEGLSLKKFIISTNCPSGPKEILLSGKGGALFKVKDFNTLSNLIKYYYYNKSKRNRKINFGFKSLNRFDFNTNLHKYLKIINSL